MRVTPTGSRPKWTLPVGRSRVAAPSEASGVRAGHAWVDHALKSADDTRPQLTAFLTSALILASSVAVNSFSAKTTGHIAPSSRFAASLKPSVEYLVLNFCAGWKKQRTSPSLAYAGMPYQVLGERAGALALMIAWSRLAMARSGSRISAIFASTALSPSALSARGPRSAALFSSWTCSFIAARSSSVNPLNFSLIAVVLLADFCMSFFGLMETSLNCEGLWLKQNSHRVLRVPITHRKNSVG